jgi:signal transduction histidine kinase
MARTLSVPQRGSIAAIGNLEAQSAGSFFELAGVRGFGHRGLCLLVAAILTAAGAVVPHLDVDLLSTVLFVAGAGLATLVVVLPWQSLSQNDAGGGERQPDVPPAFGGDKGRQIRFPELLTAASTQANLDRAAWAKLTAHMSHELRTPLNAVLGFSELMTNEVFGPLGSTYSAYARDIHASGRILLKSAEDALAITALLTAPDRKRAREISRIKAVVDEACAFAAPDLAARSITYAIDVPADIEVVGDHQAMRQMLINLLMEAAQKAATGAVIRIVTKANSEGLTLSLALSAHAKGAETADGFGMILARTFCELSGAELSSGVTQGGEWTSTVRLLRAVQADLFAAA